MAQDIDIRRTKRRGVATGLVADNPTAYRSDSPIGQTTAAAPSQAESREGQTRAHNQRLVHLFVKFVSSLGREGLYIARYALRGKFKENYLYISNT